jgi:hypothetical protein
VENSIEITQKTKNRIPAQSNCPTPGYISKVDESVLKRDT